MMVVLEQMSDQDFKDFLHHAIADYAQEKVKAGTWEEKEALDRSREDFDKLLPQGKNSRDHYLFNIVDHDLNQKIGYFWLNIRDKKGKEAFIYDFFINESYRGKGYGTQTMLAAEKEAKKLGVRKISLHVFGHNQIAIELYKKVGYLTTDLHMSKGI